MTATKMFSRKFSYRARLAQARMFVTIYLVAAAAFVCSVFAMFVYAIVTM